jgi:3'-phosphoadenosine 5'-phosphosulfate sulfotransferase (PAPS reductase)/FAD synthetase
MNAIADLFIPERQPDQVATDPMIEEAARAGAWFVFSQSGGKDCGAALALGNRWLDALGHPRSRRYCEHSDLGRAEWATSLDQVKAQADAAGLPLRIDRARAGDLPARFQDRWDRGLADYVALKLYNLRGPWSSPSLKFCQSEKKIQVMGPALAQRHRGETIVQVTGLRRDESRARASTPVAKVDHRFAKRGNRWGTQMLVWNPCVEMTADDVFAANRRHGIPLSMVYDLGCSRHSCAACIMGSRSDLEIAGRVASNAPLFSLYIEMEIASTFSFQAGSWLADRAPHLVRSRDALNRAKRLADRRRVLEAEMPARHRYVDGWPLFVPDYDEAQIIYDARHEILAMHDLSTPYDSPAKIIDRFAELVAARDLKRAA